MAFLTEKQFDTLEQLEREHERNGSDGWTTGIDGRSGRALVKRGLARRMAVSTAHRIFCYQITQAGLDHLAQYDEEGE